LVSELGAYKHVVILGFIIIWPGFMILERTGIKCCIRASAPWDIKSATGFHVRIAIGRICPEP